MVEIKDDKTAVETTLTGYDFTPAVESKSDAQQDGADRLNKPLDIIFLQDTTGSQGPYINAARKAIRGICDKISASADISKDLIRFGLIAFRDHPPQESFYVMKNFGFTSDIEQMETRLASLIASGGGDGPEAQTAAIAAALNTEWREDAMKVVILITDSPPHGLGEPGDGFNKSPDQNDPLELARQMAERGITLFLIACEPTLSQSYIHALDFYTALTDITSGRVFPLLMADKLGDFIVGTVVETVETERLIDEYEKVIVDAVYNKSKPMEAVSQNLQEFIASRGIKMTNMRYEDVYTHSAVAEMNKVVWGSAASIAVGRDSVKPVTEPRLKGVFGAMRSSPAGMDPLYPRAPTAVGRATPYKWRAPVATTPGETTVIKLGAPTGFGAMSAFAPKAAFGAATGTFGTTGAFGATGALEAMTQAGGETGLEATTGFGATTEFGAFGETAFFGSSSGGSPAPSPPSAADPVPMMDILYEKATINQKQAARIVQQAVSRSSKVTAQGYVSRTSGVKVPNQFEKKP